MQKAITHITYPTTLLQLFLFFYPFFRLLVSHTAWHASSSSRYVTICNYILLYHHILPYRLIGAVLDFKDGCAGLEGTEGMLKEWTGPNEETSMVSKQTPAITAVL